MNIGEAAAKYGVSRQAIYQALDKLPDKGKTGKKGEISPDGVKLLDKKYQAKQAENSAETACNVNLDKDTSTALQAKIDALLLDIQALQEKLTAAKQEKRELLHKQEVLQVKFDAIQAERDKLAADTVERQQREMFLQAMFERLTREKIQQGTAEPEQVTPEQQQQQPEQEQPRPEQQPQQEKAELVKSGTEQQQQPKEKKGLLSWLQRNKNEKN